MKKEVIVFGAVYLVVVEGAILLLLALQKNTTLEKETIFITGSLVLLVAFVIMKILKRVIHKKRPAKKIELFTPFDKYAFPSGHATGLAAVSFFIFEHNILLGIISIFIGLIVVLSRMKAHVHDFIDITGGIILGSFIAYTTSPYIELFVSTYLLF